MAIYNKEDFVNKINKLNPNILECTEQLRIKLYESDLNYYKFIISKIFEIDGYKEAFESKKGIPLELTDRAYYLLGSYHVPRDMYNAVLFYNNNIEHYVEIASYNEAFKTVKNLQIRVLKKCGKLTNFDIYFNSEGINGIAEGENGKVCIESILAGGYNIQRLHIRCLIKPLKN